jgi:uncharacterized protein YuzE
MKVRYDKDVDILVIRFSDLPITESDEDKPGVIIDYAEDGTIVGLEIMNASKKLSQPNKVEYEIA